MRYQHEGATLVLTCTPSLAPSQGDLNEFNQCQTQLLALYKKGIKGSVMEFRAYTLLYLLHQNQASELAAILKTLTDVCPALATMHAPSPAPLDTSHTYPTGVAVFRRIGDTPQWLMHSQSAQLPLWTTITNSSSCKLARPRLRVV